ncbi:MAG: hypothetical protein HY834_12450 [Devosia nanyangense]|uniref:Outer membrane protein beta-barrel domain-containing protein n=1 Tax=Devosia nanyangense TaxID=1228055 RepID=A0A933NX46_9HYPH|nr:hypothetical protein [Devosia nanyangense]
MGLFRTATLAAMLSAAPFAASAADLLTVPVSTNEAVPVADASFDWNGFYAGVYGIAQTSPVGGSQYGLGVDFGAYARFDFVLVGGEVAYHGLVGGGGSTSYLQGIGTLGLAATDAIILYAAAGAGVDLGPPAESDILVGGGVDFAVADSVTLKAQYLHGFPLTGANPKDQVSVGANFHF